MLDMMNKMAELKFEAPLAQFEESEEWTKMMDDESPLQSVNKTLNHVHRQGGGGGGGSQLTSGGARQDIEQLDNMFTAGRGSQQEPNKMPAPSSSPSSASCTQCGANNNLELTTDGDNFGETFSGSLEDLVHTFDDKITRCFCDYEESVEKLAPVQIRTQEEIMNECQ